MIGLAEDGKEFVGHNIKAHIADLEKQVREAVSEFETTACAAKSKAWKPLN